MVRYLKWKKLAHKRNSQNAFEIFEEFIELLENRGYEFVSMIDLANQAKLNKEIKNIFLDEKDDL